jgi:hypothetical protein
MTYAVTLGFDKSKGKFVGTWIGSPMDRMWIYEGELDDSGKVLTLHNEGPSFSDPNKIVQYKDVIEIVDENHRKMSSYVQGENGEFERFMQVGYRRK